VQQKAILLNDMLNNVDQGEKIGIDGDAYNVRDNQSNESKDTTDQVYINTASFPSV
jgi:hypothetical protein